MSDTLSTSTEDHSAVIDSSIRLIPINEVAALLSCSQRHVQRLTDDGRMPGPVRLGGHLVRWNLAELQDWIQNGCPERQVNDRLLHRSGSSGRRVDE